MTVPPTLRRLVRRPASALAVILLLATGGGVAGAIATIVESVLRRPLPYADPDRLVAVFTVERDGTEPRNPSSPADFLDWADRSRTLEGWAAAHPVTFVVASEAGVGEVAGLAVTPGLFATLGVAPELGRTFVPGETEPHRVVLGHGYWQRELGGRGDVVGRPLLLDGVAHQVVGVMPASFRFPPFWATDAELWVPRSFDPEQASDRRARFLRVFARLAPEADRVAAQDEMTDLARLGLASHPEEAAPAVAVEPLREPTVAAVRPALLALLGGSAFMLVVAVGSAGILLLARAAEGRRDTAVRLALGASRRRLVAEAAGEAALLAGIGGALGAVLAMVGARALVAAFPGFLPPVARVTASGAGLGTPWIATVLLASLAGAAAVPWGSERLRRGAPSGRARRLTVGVQIALAVVLAAGAAVTAREVRSLGRAELGFPSEGLLAADLPLGGSRTLSGEDAAGADAPLQARLFEEIVAETERVSGVSSAAVVNHLPLRGDLWRLGVAIEGRVLPDDAAAAVRAATPGYFATLGTRMVSGRAFTAADRADGEPVAVVNATFARRYGGGEDLIGRRIRVGGGEAAWRRVVGVSRDVRQTGPAEPMIPEVVVPLAQNPHAWFGRGTLLVRHVAAPGLVEDLRTAVAGVDPGVPVVRPEELPVTLAERLAPERLQLALAALFASATLLLAAAGVHGTASVFVATRGSELGLRQALGATPLRVARWVVGDGLRLAGPGIAAGLVAAIAGSRIAAAALGTTVAGAADLALAISVVAIAVLGAVGWPARRAARISPMQALRRDAAGR